MSTDTNLNDSGYKSLESAPSCSQSEFDEFHLSANDQDRSLYKVDDPLSEPIVKLSLERVHLTADQLIEMSVKELNKRLTNCPAFIVAKLKRCRRTLKNRGYAKNCRIKRIAAKNQLEHVNVRLLAENRELRHRNKSLTEQLNHMRTNVASNVGISAQNMNQYGQQSYATHQDYAQASHTTATYNGVSEDTYTHLESELDSLAAFGAPDRSYVSAESLWQTSAVAAGSIVIDNNPNVRLSNM